MQMPSRCTSAPVAILDRALRPDHPEIATNLNNLGALYEVQGRRRRRRTVVRALIDYSKESGAIQSEVGGVGRPLMTIQSLALVIPETNGKFGTLRCYRHSGSGARLIRTLGLDRWTGHRSVGADTQQCPAFGRSVAPQPVHLRRCGRHQLACSPISLRHSEDSVKRILGSWRSDLGHGRITSLWRCGRKPLHVWITYRSALLSRTTR